MSRRATRALLATGLLIAAMAASDAAKPDRAGNGDVLESMIASDTALLGNISEAAVVFGDRLQQRVTAQDELILVADMPDLVTIEARDHSLVHQLQPVLRLSVSFGSGTTDDGSIIEVPLSKAAPTDAQCRQLLPILGKKIVTLLH